MPGETYLTVEITNKHCNIPSVAGTLDNVVACASEEVAIRNIFPHEITTYDPYEAEVKVWQV